MRYSEHFWSREFECPCCGRVEMDTQFLSMLQATRSAVGLPFSVTSGYRCPRHNERIKGAQNSAHMRGMAADIMCYSSETRWKIINEAISAGFRRIGIGASFVHLDNDPSLPNPRIWVY